MTADRYGNQNSAYSFDGSDDYILIDDPVITEPPYTVSFWVSFGGSTGTNQVMIANGGETLWVGFVFFVVGYSYEENPYDIDKSIAFRGQGEEGDVSQAFAPLQKPLGSDNEWHHVVGIWDGADDVELYIDGVKHSMQFMKNLTLDPARRFVHWCKIDNTAQAFIFQRQN